MTTRTKRVLGFVTTWAVCMLGSAQFGLIVELRHHGGQTHIMAISMLIGSIVGTVLGLTAASYPYDD